MDDVMTPKQPNPFLSTAVGRRSLLGLVAGVGTAALAACGSSGGASSTPTTTASTAPVDTASGATTSALAGTDEVSGDGACSTVIPEETTGPFPGDGSNGQNVLHQEGVVRQDIRSSFGSSTTPASGIPLGIRLVLRDAAGCAALANAAVYAWHCDQDGRYSMYSNGVEAENYLRGVQPADASGNVNFQTVFPGAYSGRWPHVHFEVYSSVADATGGGRPIATSQVALPPEICSAVYETPGYESSRSNFAGMSINGDMVFGDDGGVHQIGTMSGSIDNGLTVTLTVPVLVS